MFLVVDDGAALRSLASDIAAGKVTDFDDLSITSGPTGRGKRKKFASSAVDSDHEQVAVLTLCCSAFRVV